MGSLKRLLVAGCVGALLLAAPGCATRLGDLTVVSTRGVSLNRVDLDALPQERGVTGKDYRWVILFVPLGVPHLEDAIDDALEKGHGDVLVDATVHNRFWWFLIGKTGLEVKGTVVRTRGGQ